MALGHGILWTTVLILLALGVVQLSRLNSWSLVDKVENAEFTAAFASPQIGGRTTGVPYGGFPIAMDKVRFQRGMPAR